MSTASNLKNKVKILCTSVEASTAWCAYEPSSLISSECRKDIFFYIVIICRKCCKVQFIARRYKTFFSVLNMLWSLNQRPVGPSLAITHYPNYLSRWLWGRRDNLRNSLFFLYYISEESGLFCCLSLLALQLLLRILEYKN